MSNWQAVSKPDSGGRVRYHCLRCPAVAVSKYSPERINHECSLSGVALGVGAHLMMMFRAMGIKADNCKSDCPKWASDMDDWGPAGCEARRAEIVARLNSAYRKLTYAEVMKAISGSVVSGLAFKINPLDVAGSLLTEAIRRATATGCDS